MSIGKGFGQYIRDDLNKNDEWYTPPHIVKLIMPYIPKGATVWCPFDTEESYYVRLFKQAGYNVIHSHVWEGKDFFTYEPSEPYDYIVSNPPYSIKDAVYERLFMLGKPWAMFTHINGIFDSDKRFGMFSTKGIQLLVPNGRTKFFKDYKNQNEKSAPPFQCMYVCWNVLPETIIFEQEENGLFDSGAAE